MYINKTASGGAPGDQYTGLDAFGRVANQRWLNTSTSAAVDLFQYTHDRDDNVLSRSNLINSSIYESYTYDGLNQLTVFTQGSTHSQDYDYDALGNFDSVTTDGDSPLTRPARQIRDADRQAIGELLRSAGGQFACEPLRLISVRQRMSV